jgi:hypothetical protein
MRILPPPQNGTQIEPPVSVEPMEMLRKHNGDGALKQNEGAPPKIIPSSPPQ